jgi:hypothetical protein
MSTPDGPESPSCTLRRPSTVHGLLSFRRLLFAVFIRVFVPHLLKVSRWARKPVLHAPLSAVCNLHSCIRSPFVDGLLSRRAGKPVLHAPPSIHRPPSPVHRPLRSAVCLRSISHPPTQTQASCARNRWEYPDAPDPVPHHKSRGDERFAPPSHTASADIPALAHNLRRPSSRL